MPPLLADFSHARACKPKCEKLLTLPTHTEHQLPQKTPCRHAPKLSMLGECPDTHIACRYNNLVNGGVAAVSSA